MALHSWLSGCSFETLASSQICRLHYRCSFHPSPSCAPPVRKLVQAEAVEVVALGVLLVVQSRRSEWVARSIAWVAMVGDAQLQKGDRQTLVYVRPSYASLAGCGWAVLQSFAVATDDAS